MSELPGIVCPGCEGQSYDIGACGSCDNIGLLTEDGERIERGNCPECNGAGGHLFWPNHMGTISDEEATEFRPFWSTCLACHGSRNLDEIRLAVYRARGGPAPVQRRGYA